MNKKVLVSIIIILIILCVGEAYFFVKERNEKIALSTSPKKNSTIMKPSGGRPKAVFIMKGQKFSENALYAKAYLIFPVVGSLSADAQKALVGWDVKTTANSDGSSQIDLIPKEAEDIRQSFTIKQGYKLYFIEMNLADDQTGVDENRGDDIGVLVNQDGIVQ